MIEARSGGRDRRVRARYVVGADGARSLVARKAGLSEADASAIGIATRGYFRLDRPLPPAFHIHIPLPMDGHDSRFAGYGWAFPVGDGTVNIGIGFFPTRPVRKLPSLSRLFGAFLAQLGQDPAFAGLRLLEPLKGGLLVSGNEPHRCHGERVLLVGDAAGLVDPFTGEGIHAAIKSGALAAEVLDGALGRHRTGSGDLRAYGELLRTAFEDERDRGGPAPAQAPSAPRARLLARDRRLRFVLVLVRVVPKPDRTFCGARFPPQDIPKLSALPIRWAVALYRYSLVHDFMPATASVASSCRPVPNMPSASAGGMDWPRA